MHHSSSLLLPHNCYSGQVKRILEQEAKREAFIPRAVKSRSTAYKMKANWSKANAKAITRRRIHYPSKP